MAMDEHVTQPVHDGIYVFKSGYQSGPFSLKEARDILEAMGPTGAFFWKPPMDEWKPAHELSSEKVHLPHEATSAPRLLVVDDDPLMRELVKIQVSPLTTDIVLAVDVGEAREFLKNADERFTAVISDYMMPGEDGIDLVRWVKKFDPDLEVILLTARDDKETVKLGYAHEKGFLHLDIKPSNIMNVGDTAEKPHVKILDFGISRYTGSRNGSLQPDSENIIGSPIYMAPERFAASGLDVRTDLYSLGCVFYHLISEEEPFAADDKKQIAIRHFENNIRPLAECRPDCPPSLADWVMRLLKPEMADRPATVAEARDLLHAKSG